MWLTVLFWILLGLTGFALVLALQMRLMIGVVVARALRARDNALDIRASRLAMVRAGNGETGDDAVDHIHATYPAQIQQLRLARRASLFLPGFLLLVLLAGRLGGRI